MKRSPSPTYVLAKRFVNEILEQEFDPRFSGQHLKHAKQLINPEDADLVPLDPELIMLCLKEMKEGGLGWSGNLNSLYAVTWGTPPFYQRFINGLREVPPVYEITNYDRWIIQYGRLAKSMGFFDGVYRGYEHPAELKFRMPRQAIELALNTL